MFALTDVAPYVKMLVFAAEGLGFKCSSQVHTWVAGPIPAPGQGACGRQQSCVSVRLMCFFSLSLSPCPSPLFSKSMDKISSLLRGG